MENAFPPACSCVNRVVHPVKEGDLKNNKDTNKKSGTQWIDFESDSEGSMSAVVIFRNEIR